MYELSDRLHGVLQDTLRRSLRKSDASSCQLTRDSEGGEEAIDTEKNGDSSRMAMVQKESVRYVYLGAKRDSRKRRMETLAKTQLSALQQRLMYNLNSNDASPDEAGILLSSMLHIS